jgi:hypothetical protein
MTREERMLNGRPVLVQVPIYLDDEPDDANESDDAKKRPPAKDKKVHAPEPDEPGRPRPKIRTK